MKKTIIGIAFLAIAVLVGMSSYTSTNYEKLSKVIAEDSEGKKLFEKVCTACHRTSPPETQEDRKAMLAPPIMGVMFHVNDGVRVDSPEDKKQAVIDFIVDYAHNPSAEKSFCEKHAIERFGVMPTQKNSITKKELIKVANYLYDAYPSGSVDHEELQKKMGGNESKKDCKDGGKKCKNKKSCKH